MPIEKLNSIYRGVVEDNNDPLQSGRCRIRILGLHTSNKNSDVTSGVPTEDLVWAQPCTPIFGGVSGVGMFGSPSQGAHVFVFFENGNILQPRFFATAPGIPSTPSTPDYGFNDPSGENPKIGNRDWFQENVTGSNPADVIAITDKMGNSIKMSSGSSGRGITVTNGATQEKTTHDENGTTNDADKLLVAAKDLKLVSSENMSQNVSGKFTGSYGSQMESVIGDKKITISGSSDSCVTGIENKTSGGLSWDVQGNTAIKTAKGAGYISDKETLIKSNTDNIKMEATLKNIEMKAIAGNIKGEALMVNITATTIATFKGTAVTTVGGGMLTNITGQIIMIG